MQQPSIVNKAIHYVKQGSDQSMEVLIIAAVSVVRDTFELLMVCAD
jgi:hypothetical protein